MKCERSEIKDKKNMQSLLGEGFLFSPPELNLKGEKEWSEIENASEK